MIRKSFAAALVLAFVAGTCQGQQWADKMFKVKKHSFGTVARGSKQVHRFELQNLYKETVHIRSVRASCGCTIPSIETKTLNSLETGAVIAEYNTKGYLGKRSATLTVTIDKPFYAEVQLFVDGYIRSDIVFEPGQLEFGEVDPGEAVTKKVKVTYAGSSNWQITDVRSLNKSLGVQLNPTGRSGGKVTYEMLVTLSGDAPVGALNDKLVIQTNDTQSNIPLAVTGRVVPAVSISPASLFMGSLTQGATVTKQVVVRAKKPFRILGVQCDSGDFQFQPSDEAKKLHIIPITFTAGTTGKIAETITVETDLGDSTAQCVISATVQAPSPQTAANDS